MAKVAYLITHQHSGSYLISHTPVTAAQATSFIHPQVIEKPPILPEPNWSYLEEPNQFSCMPQQQVIEHLTNNLMLAHA
jgi:hypothetical protein